MDTAQVWSSAWTPALVEEVAWIKVAVSGINGEGGMGGAALGGCANLGYGHKLGQEESSSAEKQTQHGWCRLGLELSLAMATE